LEAGQASAQISLSSTRNIGLQLAGESGVIGLGLFKLRWPLGGVNILGEDDSGLIETESDWSQDVEDDL
jgi:hypothetical protein